VFVDLDGAPGGSAVFTYAAPTGSWTKLPINAQPCPDGGSLIPRDAGYTVGTSHGPLGDRLIILGGEEGDNNVYYSDSCGQEWKCYDADQIWKGREFAPIAMAPGVLPGDPVVMAGGVLDALDGGGFSVGVFMSYDFGITWVRPQCYTIADCAYALPAPDTSGACVDNQGDGYFRHCYVLPDTPVLSGGLAADWDNYYVFYEAEDTPEPDGVVFRLGKDNFATGFTEIAGAGDGGAGRKVFIRGGTYGTGCWFSTDWLAEECVAGRHRCSIGMHLASPHAPRSAPPLPPPACVSAPPTRTRAAFGCSTTPKSSRPTSFTHRKMRAGRGPTGPPRVSLRPGRRAPAPRWPRRTRRLSRGSPRA
jgi:hypothetical protein